MLRLTITKWKYEIQCENWLLQTKSIFSYEMHIVILIVSERTFSTRYRRNFIPIWSTMDGADINKHS